MYNPEKSHWWNIARTSYGWLVAFGIDPLRTFHAAKGFPLFVCDYLHYRRERVEGSKSASPLLLRPCLADRYEGSGVSSGHYFHQDMLVARKIHERGPSRHVDIGSRIDGFVAHVAVFRSIEVFDIRTNTSQVHNVTFRQCDLMAPAVGFENCCDSLSCLHALEHFGLGRYGDPVSATGYRQGFFALVRLLKPEGKLYLSVPVGRERVEFNAHRVFGIQTILDLASETGVLSFAAFSYVDDVGELHEGVDLSPEAIAESLGLRYGCGIFEFTKNASASEP